ncbi:hypothetical protein HPB52_025314 [Rhipicephalus sanguineus]|uniref:C2H2-type domain-containing protein n=1 Tax=Rhipicephalus sanguineus TaxID=34632 RepID=A0A9D4TEB5_RHISA|nr:hypothetical protein HPB52_025314 [Rhipicephalus sanguineus]
MYQTMLTCGKHSEADRRDNNDGARTQEPKSEEVICEVDSFNAASLSESSCPAPINDEIGLLLPKREPEEIVCAVDCSDGYFPTHIDSSDANLGPYSPKSEMAELGITTEGSYGPSLFGRPGNMPITGPLAGNVAESNSSGTLRCWWDPSIVNRFVQRSQLHVHLKSHSGERPHECMECGKRFVLLSHLDYHRNNVHGNAEKSHVCPQCWPRLRAARRARSAHALARDGEATCLFVSG